jgi:NADP-dependent aldehyde dehydrogenase
VDHGGAAEHEARAWTIEIGIHRGGSTVFWGDTSVGQIKRGFDALAAFLFRSQVFPHGAMMLTGTGVVPPDAFTLQERDVIEIRISKSARSPTRRDRLMAPRHVLIAGGWRASQSSGTFAAQNPATGERLNDDYPVSAWEDCDAALSAAAEAAVALRRAPASQIADFLTRFADRLDARKEELVERAHLETGLPTAPRLRDVELPRTSDQLRQAAAAALEGTWALPTIDTKLNIRSCLAPLGPVVVFGPNNFPFAFPARPAVTSLPRSRQATRSSRRAILSIPERRACWRKKRSAPPEKRACLRHRAIDPSDGPGVRPQTRRRSTHRRDGLYWKSQRRPQAQDGGRRGRQTDLLELSSINPVVILPGALEERGAKLAEEFSEAACLAAGNSARILDSSSCSKATRRKPSSRP